MNHMFLCLIFYFFNFVHADDVTGAKHGLGIINGQPANITEVPFFAIYREVGQLYGCGASIVHEQFLVTTAACVKSNQPNNKAEVVVGTDNIRKGEKYEIDTTYIHPKFDAKHSDYDIGVIKLKQKLKLSENVNIIKMADSSVLIKKASMFETFGFGSTNRTEDVRSENLLKLKLQVFDRNDCAKQVNRRSIHVTERMICAGFSGIVSFDNGDQGGALRFKDLLLGVASVYTLYVPLPGLYAYIPSMRDFIDKTIEDNL